MNGSDVDRRADLDDDGDLLVDEDPQESDLDADLLARSSEVPARRMGWLLVVLGLVGFVASLALAVEKYLKLLDPDRTASCSINIFLDCSAAMGSWQGGLLGFPNPLIGVAAFPVVVTTGVVLLTGARLPRWYWLSLLTGTLAALGLIVFLIHTSVAVLGKLCPYCMVVWAVMLPLAWYTLTYAVQERHVRVSERARSVLVKNRTVIVVLLYVVVVAWVGIGLYPAIADHIQRG